jgi:hypothetical protein
MANPFVQGELNTPDPEKVLFTAFQWHPKLHSRSNWCGFGPPEAQIEIISERPCA